MASCHRVTDNKDVTKFDGTFFNVWKHPMTLFMGERFWPIVEGIEPKPVASTIEGAQVLPSTGKGTSIVEWEDKDALAFSIINNCLDNLIVSHIQHCKSASNAWKQLCDMYETKDVVSRMYLRDKLQSLKMRETKSLTKHLHTYRSILEQLASIGSRVDKEDAIFSLMRSMPSGYKPYLTTLRRQQGLSLQGLIAYFLQEEI